MINLNGKSHGNKKIFIHILSWLPALIIMTIIFSFSANVADDSAKTSGGLTKKVVYVIEKITGNEIEENSVRYEEIHHIVRKAGHFLEFMTLGCTFVLPYALITDKKISVFILCEMSSAFYACTDEFHQIFVDGRDGNLKDVCIDSCGAFAGICVGFIIWFVLGKLFKKIHMENKMSFLLK